MNSQFTWRVAILVAVLGPLPWPLTSAGQSGAAPGTPVPPKAGQPGSATTGTADEPTTTTPPWRPDQDLAPPTGATSWPAPEAPTSSVPAADPLLPGNDSLLSGGSRLSGGGPFGLMSDPVLGRLTPRADYRVTWFPDQFVPGQGTHLGFVQEDLNLSTPLWQDAHNEWSASVHVRNEIYHTDGTILPSPPQPFPDELWNVRFGTSYRHLFDNGWIAGAAVSVGSASDQPFHSINVMTAGVNAFLRIPSCDHNAWLFTLSYSANGELAFPIPGVAYLWQPSDQLRMNIGLPFQVMYRPVENLTLDASYMLLTTVHARATYRVLPALRVYGAFSVNNESYFLADSPDSRDRFFYYDDRLTAGLQWVFNRHAVLDLSGGYAFNRYYFEGRSFSDRSDRVDVGNTPFVSLQLQTRW
jgi:hypothetical protein